MKLTKRSFLFDGTVNCISPKLRLFWQTWKHTIASTISSKCFRLVFDFLASTMTENPRLAIPFLHKRKTKCKSYQQPLKICVRHLIPHWQIFSHLFVMSNFRWNEANSRCFVNKHHHTNIPQTKSDIVGKARCFSRKNKHQKLRDFF